MGDILQQSSVTAPPAVAPVINGPILRAILAPATPSLGAGYVGGIQLISPVAQANSRLGSSLCAYYG